VAMKCSSFLAKTNILIFIILLNGIKKVFFRIFNHIFTKEKCRLYLCIIPIFYVTKTPFFTPFFFELAQTIDRASSNDDLSRLKLSYDFLGQKSHQKPLRFRVVFLLQKMTF